MTKQFRLGLGDGGNLGGGGGGGLELGFLCGKLGCREELDYGDGGGERESSLDVVGG